MLSIKAAGSTAWNRRLSMVRRLPTCPLPALGDSRALRMISVLGVAGILRRQIAGQLRAFSAMDKALLLTADRHGALTVKGMAAGLHAAPAAAGLFERAGRAVQSAS